MSLALRTAQTWGPGAALLVCAGGVRAGALLGHLSLRSKPEAVHAGGAAARPAQPLRWTTMFSPAALCLLAGYVAHCAALLGTCAWTPSPLETAMRPLRLDTLTRALLIGATLDRTGM